MREEEIRRIARSAAGRALADRGRGLTTRRTGVSVDPALGNTAPRPGTEAPKPSAPAYGEVVTARCLEATPQGGEYVVPFGAQVTPLARDEAWQRNIRLVGALGSEGAPGGRMRVAVASDHGGFEMKQAVLDWVRELGHEPLDFGTQDTGPVDYPDQALAVALAVSDARAHLGIVVDGAGIGSAMAANKVPGIRAAMCYDKASANNAREHNFANVLTLGGRSIAPEAARDVVATFLATPTGAARHKRRIDKITAIEQRYSRTEVPAKPQN